MRRIAQATEISAPQVAQDNKNKQYSTPFRTTIKAMVMFLTNRDCLPMPVTIFLMRVLRLSGA